MRTELGLLKRPVLPTTNTAGDKNHAPFKLNGHSRTAFGLLNAPELQRLSVTVELLRVGVIRPNKIFFTKENIISCRSNKNAFSD
jgi:hypothetical protein